MIGRSYTQLNNYKSALNFLNKAINLGANDANPFLFLGISNSQLGNYQQAITNFDMAIERDDINFVAFFKRGVAKVMDTKGSKDNIQTSEQNFQTFEEAKEDFIRANKLSQTGSDSKIDLDCLYWIAMCNCELEIFDEAIEVLNELLVIDSKFQKAYVIRGIAKSELKRFKEAIIDFDKAYDLWSDDIENIFYRGLAKYDSSLLEESLVDLNKVIELKPKDVRFLNNRGLLLCDLKQFDQAIKDYESVIKIEPNNNIALIAISKIKDFLGNKFNKKDFDNKAISKLLENKYKY